jgi:hypothetical protein
MADQQQQAKGKGAKEVAEVYVDPFERDEQLNKFAADYARYIEMPERAKAEVHLANIIILFTLRITSHPFPVDAIDRTNN